MIIDRTWNKHTQNYVISYLDENGNRKMWNRYMHHWTTYEYDDNGNMETWDGKKCQKVFKDASEYSPCEFDQLELLYSLKDSDPKLLKELHASRSPRTYVFDIETKYIEGQFPYPEKAEHDIVAISLVGPDGSCIVYGSHDLTGEQKEKLRNRYINWIRGNEYAMTLIDPDKIKVLYQYFSDEKSLLKHFFLSVLPKISCLTGWNTYNFDFQYITNRIINLFGKVEAYSMIKRCSPTGEISMMRVDDGFGNKFQIPTPKHTLWLDEMQLVKDYDYILRPYENYSLDYVGERAVKANKIKYTEHGLNELLKQDPETYYFYNAIDSLIVMLIRNRLKCIESPCAVASLTLVPILKAFGQVALTTANIFNEFYLDDKHVVYKRSNNVKVPYEGAFTACIPGRAIWTVCSDYSSLYPKTVISTNLSFENIVDKWTEPDKYGRREKIPWTDEELDKFKADPNYFVSEQITIFKKAGKNWNAMFKESEPDAFGQRKRIPWTREEAETYKNKDNYLVADFHTVFKNDKDYAFRKMMQKLLDGRSMYKYTGNDIEGQLLPYIDDLIKEKS